jgi:hypothetical protein
MKYFSAKTSHEDNPHRGPAFRLRGVRQELQGPRNTQKAQGVTQWNQVSVLYLLTVLG